MSAELRDYTLKQISNGWVVIENDYENPTDNLFYATRLEALEAIAASVADQIEQEKELIASQEKAKSAPEAA